MKIKRIYYAIFHPCVMARAKRYWTHWRRHVAIMRSADYYYKKLLPESLDLVDSGAMRKFGVTIDGPSVRSAGEWLRACGYDIDTRGPIHIHAQRIEEMK